MARSPLTSSRFRRRRVLLGAALLLAGVASSAALLVGRAPAQSATEELSAKIEELDQLNARQGDIEARIAAQNALINDLIGRESEVRRRESAVEAELDRVQAELDDATTAFERERAHLDRVRARLDRAVAGLERLLVELYKSGGEDTLSVVLASTNWSDLIARTEYLDAAKHADDATIARVRDLEGEVEDLVDQLRDTRERIKRARDQVAARKRELTEARSQLEARHAELAAAQAARRTTLAQIEDRQDVLADDLAEAGAPVPGETATLLPNGDAVPPEHAPLVVRAVIEAANRINDLPYVWGGGHGSFEDSGYDCSGAVSYALHGGGLLDSPLDSTGLEFWGEPGAGSWITVYANSGHTFAFIAGLRWDTGGNGGGYGPRWHTDLRSGAGLVARHPSGL